MHYTAYEYGRAFFNIYVNPLKNDLTIVEIGSQDVNGAIKDHAPSNAKYIGLDFIKGKSVDIVLNDAYHFPMANNSVDVVVTSSCFEHSQFFWLSFLEGLRILKPDGIMYVSAPSNGAYHRYPTDNWRFYPDAGKALAAYANKEGINTEILESFIGAKDPYRWRDFVAIFIKDAQYANLYSNRIYNTIPDKLKPNNVWSYGNEDLINIQNDMSENNKLVNCNDLNHKTYFKTKEYKKAFFNAYVHEKENATILEIDSTANIDSTLDNSVDAIIMNYFLARSQLFWLDFMEAIRALKPEGLLYINVPSNGYYCTDDNWRFYPDSGKALSDYANIQGFNTKLLESFIGAGDFVAVLIKDEQFTNLYSNRIYNIVPKILEPENIWIDENKEILNYKSNMKSNNLLGEESDIIFSEL